MEPTAQTAQAAIEVPIWMIEGSFWLAVGAFLAMLVSAFGVWVMVARIRELHEEEKQLSILSEIEGNLERLVSMREDLDLRRVEHLLIDMRDGLKRLEERSFFTAPNQDVPTDSLVPVPAMSLGERVTNRLLAEGFERVALLPSEEELKALLESGAGDVNAEARRDGVLFKGRVTIRGGRIEGVEMNPAYSIFP